MLTNHRLIIITDGIIEQTEAVDVNIEHCTKIHDAGLTDRHYTNCGISRQVRQKVQSGTK